MHIKKGASAAAEPEVKASRARKVKALMVQPSEEVQPSEDAQSSTGAVGSLEKASGSKRKKVTLFLNRKYVNKNSAQIQSRDESSAIKFKCKSILNTSRGVTIGKEV